MRRAILTLLVLFTVGGVVAAQKDCGDGLPCGKLLWDLPVIPTLASPTPMPTIQITAVQTATTAPTGAASATPAPTRPSRSACTQRGSTATPSARPSGSACTQRYSATTVAGS